VILNAIAALIGFALIAVGLFLAWPPLAILWCGAGLLAFGFLREVPDGPAE
jgi:hypothetical protein